jgi:hypothetical protein
LSNVLLCSLETIKHKEQTILWLFTCLDSPKRDAFILIKKTGQIKFWLLKQTRAFQLEMQKSYVLCTIEI